MDLGNHIKESGVAFKMQTCIANERLYILQCKFFKTLNSEQKEKKTFYKFIVISVTLWFMSLVHSSGRWRTRYASAVRCLSAHHALKPLVASLVLLVVVIYGLGDKLRNFVASIFIPQYRYPYPVALSFAQVGVCNFWIFFFWTQPNSD